MNHSRSCPNDSGAPCPDDRRGIVNTGSGARRRSRFSNSARLASESCVLLRDWPGEDVTRVSLSAGAETRSAAGERAISLRDRLPFLGINDIHTYLSDRVEINNVTRQPATRAATSAPSPARA
ncbi:hypothetical protein GCM10022252_13490 [Streptosporangium oxazolinicum]|uniref:Uncharacterized protein n=1 Tax=Streptosporangium oxazolinicum TaxID=909287 RepID=A0ABP8AIF0_9ACTN